MDQVMRMWHVDGHCAGGDGEQWAAGALAREVGWGSTECSANRCSWGVRGRLVAGWLQSPARGTQARRHLPSRQTPAAGAPATRQRTVGGAGAAALPVSGNRALSTSDGAISSCPQRVHQVVIKVSHPFLPTPRSQLSAGLAEA